MFSNFEIIVGIEVHVVLNTKTKMFSPSKSNHNDLPNINISPIDLGHPGIMPSPNIEAIKKGIVLAKAFNMKIQNNIVFDRKNYFYQDLPKGFQITQQFFPIGYDGKIILENESQIFLERIHLEEDTAKQFKKEDGIYLDYNRAGMPLIEIVTKPCIRSPKDASLFLKELKRILTFNKISDAKLEEGSMRADVNISVRPYGADFFGTRVEIKNINSVSNVEKAIEFETKEQIKQILSSENVKQVTKRFNDKTEKTEYLRTKTNAVDYRYLTEPNIYMKKISNKFINDVIQKNYIDLNEVKNNFLNWKISNEFINLLLDNYFLYEKFILINKKVNNPSEVIRWLCLELAGNLTKRNISIESLEQTKFDKLAEIILLIQEQKINSKQGKEILQIVCDTDKSVNTIIEENNFKQITDKKLIGLIFEKYVKENQQMIKQYNDRPERVEKFFIGMIMKETKGQANPEIATEVFKEMIRKK